MTSWKPVKREVVARVRGHDDEGDCDVIKLRWSPHAHVIVDTHLRTFVRSFSCDVTDEVSSASSVAATSNDESGEGEVTMSARKQHPCYHGDDEEDKMRIRRRNVKSWCLDSATLKEKFDDRVASDPTRDEKCDVITFIDVEVASRVKFVAELNDQNFTAFTLDNMRFHLNILFCFLKNSY